MPAGFSGQDDKVLSGKQARWLSSVHAVMQFEAKARAGGSLGDSWPNGRSWRPARRVGKSMQAGHGAPKTGASEKAAPGDGVAWCG